MLISSFSCGDSVITLTAVQPKSADDVIMYHLMFLDQFNEKTYTKVYTGENIAIRAFCAAIVCDEPDLTIDESTLRADPNTSPFLC